MEKIEFLSPAGVLPVSVGHAPRLPSLEGKRIALLSNDDWQAGRSLDMVKRLLEARVPGVQVISQDEFPKGKVAIVQESTVLAIKHSGADAVVLGNAACGACATASGVAAARLEAVGIPTVVLARDIFTTVLRNAVSGEGLAADIARAEFPMEMFLPESDLSPIDDHFDDFVWGLTKWSAPRSYHEESEYLSVSAPTYPEALAAANRLFLTSLVGDGLPMLPATREATDLILRGTGLAPSMLLGRFPPRGATVTVESCGIALAMAGGRPEYLPVLIAAVEAMLDPSGSSDQMQATSGASFPVVIVNGPIAKEIRLGSGYGCLGPDPQQPAGTSIGRALRLMQLSLGGAIPGVGTMATWGANRETNLVFAEDDEGLPDGWAPHGAERHGFDANANSVSLFWATGATNLLRGSNSGESQEQDLEEGLFRMADLMSAPHFRHYCEGYESGTPGAVLISRAVATQLHAHGYTSKADVQRFLWENSGVSQERLHRTGGLAWILKAESRVAAATIDHDPWLITSRPENIIVLVCGGDHPMHSFWIPAFSKVVIGRPITVPCGFDALMADADRALGCRAEACTTRLQQ